LLLPSGGPLGKENIDFADISKRSHSKISKVVSYLLDESIPQNFKRDFVDQIGKVDEGQPKTVVFMGNSGVGKSSIIREIISMLRNEDKSVGVIAIDPRSTFSGGAILGDRIRFKEEEDDLDLFIRSVACGVIDIGFLTNINLVCEFLKRVGFDRVIVESPGLGQLSTPFSESDSTLVLVMSPFQGDEIQMMKSGVIEDANLIFVNQSDQIQNLDIENILVNTLRISRGERFQDCSIIVGSAKTLLNIEKLMSQIEFLGVEHEVCTPENSEGLRKLE
jgi:LAO/AO transport system kinase